MPYRCFNNDSAFKSSENLSNKTPNIDDEEKHQESTEEAAKIRVISNNTLYREILKLLSCNGGA